MISFFIYTALFFKGLSSCHAFSTKPSLSSSAFHQSSRTNEYKRVVSSLYNEKENVSNDFIRELHSSSRRQYILDSTMKGLASASFLSNLLVSSANADDDGDMTSKMFNPDGSLKEGIVESTEVAFQNIQRSFGSTSSDESDTTSTQTSYLIPTTWKPSDSTTSNENYLSYTESTLKVFDGAPTETACNSITVYQAPGLFTNSKVLEKASTIGVAKSLMSRTFSSSELDLQKADLVSAGKKIDKENDITYWQFDLAVAPITCEKRQKEDLGLGFCPYDYIVLISAAIYNEKLYVFQLECDRQQWKRVNADVKRVRSSFQIVAS